MEWKYICVKLELHLASQTISSVKIQFEPTPFILDLEFT